MLLSLHGFNKFLQIILTYMAREAHQQMFFEWMVDGWKDRWGSIIFFEHPVKLTEIFKMSTSVTGFSFYVYLLHHIKESRGILTNECTYSSENGPVKGSLSFHCPVDREARYVHPIRDIISRHHRVHTFSVHLRTVNAFVSEKVSRSTADMGD